MHTIASAKLKRDSLEAGRNGKWDTYHDKGVK